MQCGNQIKFSIHITGNTATHPPEAPNMSPYASPQIPTGNQDLSKCSACSVLEGWSDMVTRSTNGMQLS